MARRLAQVVPCVTVLLSAVVLTITGPAWADSGSVDAGVWDAAEPAQEPHENLIPEDHTFNLAPSDTPEAGLENAVIAIGGDEAAAGRTAVGPDEGAAMLAADWHCTTDVYDPDIAWSADYDPPRRGIAYAAHQRCTGAYGTQRVCVRLQERDNQGDWYARTTWACDAWTVSSTSYKGQWVSCRNAREGLFRTQARAEGEGPPPDIGWGHSAGVRLCG